MNPYMILDQHTFSSDALEFANLISIHKQTYLYKPPRGHVISLSIAVFGNAVLTAFLKNIIFLLKINFFCKF
jgi:hypothetical protein